MAFNRKKEAKGKQKGACLAFLVAVAFIWILKKLKNSNKKKKRMLLNKCRRNNNKKKRTMRVNCLYLKQEKK